MGIFTKEVTETGVTDTPSARRTKRVVRPWFKVATPVFGLVALVAVEEALSKKPLIGVFHKKEGIEKKVYDTFNLNSKLYVEGKVGYALINEKWTYVPFWTSLSPATISDLETTVNITISGVPKGNSIVPENITGTIDDKKRAIYHPHGVDPSTYPTSDMPQMPTEEDLEKAGYEKIKGTFSGDGYRTFITTEGKELTIEGMNNDALKVMAKAYNAEYGGIVLYYINKGTKKKPVYSVQGIVPVKKEGTIAGLRFPTIPGVVFVPGYNEIKPKPA